MKFLQSTIPMMIAGYIGASPALADEKKCHPQVPFCEPVTVYEEGKEYSSEAVEFGDPNAYKKIIAQQRGDMAYKDNGDIAYILVKPVNITKLRQNPALEDAVGLREPKLQSETRKILQTGNYTLEAAVEGELCGDDKGIVGMQVYTAGNHRILVFYDHNSKESMTSLQLWNFLETKNGSGYEQELEHFCKDHANLREIK